MRQETIDALREVLRNRPESAKDAATNVLIVTLVSLANTDGRWEESERAGTPSITDYAGDLVEVLRRRYSGPGVRL